VSVSWPDLSHNDGAAPARHFSGIVGAIVVDNDDAPDQRVAPKVSYCLANTLPVIVRRENNGEIRSGCLIERYQGLSPFLGKEEEQVYERQDNADPYGYSAGQVRTMAQRAGPAAKEQCKKNVEPRHKDEDRKPRE
jgi:hypothetical protein